MEKNVLKNRFSLIGDFTDAYNNIDSFTEKFLKYKKDRLVNVNSVPSYNPILSSNIFKLTNNDISIEIQQGRIDFLFEKLAKDNLKVFKEKLDLFPKDKLSFITRIAINYSYWIEDSNMTLLNKISKKLNNIYAEKDVSELKYYQNFSENINGQKINNIISIENGGLQEPNSFSFKLISVVFSSFDINVPFSNSFIQFNSIESTFKTFYELLEKDIEKIDKFMEV